MGQPRTPVFSALAVALVFLAGSFSSADDLPISVPSAHPTAPVWGDPLEIPPPTIDKEEPEETPTVRIYDEEVPAEHDGVVYVIDVSGSMDYGATTYIGLEGDPTYGSRIDRAKVEVIRSLRALTEDMTFNILAYHCSLRAWRLDRVPATVENIAAATAWVRTLIARGGTATGPSTAVALDDRDVYLVALISDGAPNCGANGLYGHRVAISENNLQGAVIHTFGIGVHSSAETFMRVVASDSGGVYHAVEGS